MGHFMLSPRKAVLLATCLRTPIVCLDKPLNLNPYISVQAEAALEAQRGEDGAGGRAIQFTGLIFLAGGFRV